MLRDALGGKRFEYVLALLAFIRTGHFWTVGHPGIEMEDDVKELLGEYTAVLAADVAPVHGLSPSFVCYDELAQVPSRALYDALGTALGGRAQPLMVVISTQAATDTAPMSELIDYGLRIERGEIVEFRISFHALHGADRL